MSLNGMGIAVCSVHLLMLYKLGEGCWTAIKDVAFCVATTTTTALKALYPGQPG